MRFLLCFRAVKHVYEIATFKGIFNCPNLPLVEVRHEVFGIPFWIPFLHHLQSFFYVLSVLIGNNKWSNDGISYICVHTEKKKRDVIFGGVVGGIKQTDFISIFHEKILLPARLMNKKQWLGCRCRSRVYSIQFFILPCKPETTRQFCEYMLWLLLITPLWSILQEDDVSFVKK